MIFFAGIHSSGRPRRIQLSHGLSLLQALCNIRHGLQRLAFELLKTNSILHKEKVLYSALCGEDAPAKIDYRDIRRPLEYFEQIQLNRILHSMNNRLFVLQKATFPVGGLPNLSLQRYHLLIY
jgi:hypothetical protein